VRSAASAVRLPFHGPMPDHRPHWPECAARAAAADGQDPEGSPPARRHGRRHGEMMHNSASKCEETIAKKAEPASAESGPFPPPPPRPQAICAGRPWQPARVGSRRRSRHRGRPALALRRAPPAPIIETDEGRVLHGARAGLADGHPPVQVMGADRSWPGEGDAPGPEGAASNGDECLGAGLTRGGWRCTRRPLPRRLGSGPDAGGRRSRRP
jgi:hypothetical protein